MIRMTILNDQNESLKSELKKNLPYTLIGFLDDKY